MSEYIATMNFEEDILLKHDQSSVMVQEASKFNSVEAYPRRTSLPVSKNELFKFCHHSRPVSVFGSGLFNQEKDEFSLSYTNEIEGVSDEGQQNTSSNSKQTESHVSEVKLHIRRSSLPLSRNGTYTFYHGNRCVSVFGSEAVQLEREFSLNFTGDEVEELPKKEETNDDDSQLWDDIVEQIGQLDNPSRRLKAGSIGFEMQKQRKLFQPDDSLDTKCDLARCFPFLKQPKKTPNLQFAEKAGFKMMPNFFFPAVPKILEDFWVALELIIIFFDFIFNCVVFSGEPLDILVIAFSVVAIVLSLLDTILYFGEESSCKRCTKALKKRQKRNSLLSNKSEDSKSYCKCVIIPESYSKKIGIWTQIIRTLISELILFPLTLADLVELIELQTYAREDVENKINFGLFIVGVIFLILTVYFMRIFMALSSIANVKRLAKTTTNDPSVLIVKFCVHLVGQIIMHAVILIMISSKLNQETCRVDFTSTQDANVSITISPFLWYEIGSGAFIPLVGTMLFFLLNYPAIKQLSVSMYIDIMTAVVNESFADLIFQGEGLKTAKKKASKVAEKAQIKNTRAHFEKYKKHFTFKSRLQYRLTNPLVVVCSLVYGYAFVGFFVTHCFGYRDPCDTEGGFQFLLTKDIFVTVTFFGGILVAIVANYQLLIAIISLMVTGFLATILSPILITTLCCYCLVWTFNRRCKRSMMAIDKN